MQKIQTFEQSRYAQDLRVVSEYHPQEDVWTSDFCEPYEWDSETDMRFDIYINYVGEGDKALISALNTYCYGKIDDAEYLISTINNDQDI